MVQVRLRNLQGAPGERNDTKNADQRKRKEQGEEREIQWPQA